MLVRRPRLPLEIAVDCIWHHESRETAAHGRERVLPDGRFQLVFNLAAGAAAVSGLRANHVVIDAAGVSCAMGVVFRPGAARPFFEGSALEFYGRSVALASVWGPTATRLLDRLRSEASAPRRLGILESALLDVWTARDVRRLSVHPSVRYALRAFHNAPDIATVAAVSRGSGWSRRWLSQTFSESVGMTPKRYCRVLRFQHVVRNIASGRRVDWVDLAVSSGFADQAHLIHEFRTFSGLSPESFLRAERPSANHVRIG